MKDKDIFFDGHWFKSRLEAQWAMFYKSLGIKYEYEKEEFTFYDRKHSPGFWLPEQDCWIEIRPVGQPTWELMFFSELAKQSGKRVFLFNGAPWPQIQQAEESARAFFTPDTYYPGKPNIPPDLPLEQISDLRFIMQNYAWGICPWCRKLDIHRRIKVEGNIAVVVQDGCKRNAATLITDGTQHGGIKAAYKTAYQARFTVRERKTK